MLLKIKSLLLFSCFLITFCKDSLIETDDNNSSSSNTPSTDNYLNDAEDKLGSRDYLIENDDSTSNTRKSCGQVLCKKLLVEFAGKRKRTINLKYKQNKKGKPYYGSTDKKYQILMMGKWIMGNAGKFELRYKMTRWGSSAWKTWNKGNHRFKNIF